MTAYDKPRLLDVEPLKPCPFCGWPAKIIRWTCWDGNPMENCTQVVCMNVACKAKGKEVCEFMKQDEVDEIAIAAWNRRAGE